MHKCLFRPQGKRKETPETYQGNGEMKFNSKLKIHIIYHYLEGDWEKAISKNLLAGAVLSSVRSEPEGLLSYIPFVAATRQQLQHIEGPALLPSTRNDLPLSGDKWEGCRGTEGAST